MKVLVADDDAVMRMLLERQLSAWGHDTYLARDGGEALRAIESDSSLEVLILDWMMPLVDGLEVCRRVRSMERSHYTFIILMTSRTGKENFLAGMSAGADDFMIKPLDTDELRVRMHSAERVIHLQTEAQVNKAIAAELRELDQMKKSFIALTSHELRSPVTLIMLYLEMLAKQEESPQLENRAVVDKLYSTAQRLRHIVEEILQASRAGTYVRELNRECIDLAGLVQNTVNSVIPFAALRSQEIRVDMAPDLPKAYLDAGKIGDALANLLMNAVKFTPDGKIIVVSLVSHCPGMVRISVKDPGVGIAAEDQPHIFEQMFSSLDFTHHSSGQYEFRKRGIGMGLAIAKDFVEMHGGQVGFESAEGQGSCFHFTLPLQPCPETGINDSMEAQHDQMG